MPQRSYLCCTFETEQAIRRLSKQGEARLTFRKAVLKELRLALVCGWFFFFSVVVLVLLFFILNVFLSLFCVSFTERFLNCGQLTRMVQSAAERSGRCRRHVAPSTLRRDERVSGHAVAVPRKTETPANTRTARASWNLRLLNPSRGPSKPNRFMEPGDCKACL